MIMTKLIYTVYQKVPTFKLSVTLSNLYIFSKFFVKMLFGYSADADMEENANKF